MTSAERPTVYFHIGVPKTGTTYLQHVLGVNRAALRGAGLLYPGTGPASQWSTSHYRASLDLRGASIGNDEDLYVPGAWGRLVEQVAGWPHRALIDHESFAPARPQHIRRAREDLAFADLHVVVTARDLARQLPAVWQERVKNRSTETYHQFLRAIQAPPRRRDRPTRRFWRTFGLPEVLQRWTEGLDPSHVHIVTVPPAGSDPTLLWRRFAGLLGLDADAFDSSPADDKENRSLGAAEAATLRRFNEVVDDLGVPWPVYHKLVKHSLAVELSARRSTRIAVPQQAFDFAVDWSKQAVVDLAGAGYDVVGDLDELIPRTRPTGADPDRCPPQARFDAAIAGMEQLMAILLDSPVADRLTRYSRRGRAARAVAELVVRHPRLGAVRDAYRRVRP